MNTYKEVQGSVFWGRALFSTHLMAFIGIAAYRVIFTGQRPSWFLSLSILLFIFLVTNFWQMSITINSQSFTVGFGLIKKRLPLSKITSWQPTDYKWLRYGGWGIRRYRDGSRTFSARGRTAIALQTLTKRYVVTTPNPEHLCQVITQFKKGIVTQA